MGNRSELVDAYIAKAAPFARPILEALREAFHEADPEIVETMKWSVPHFDHKGPIAGMAAFKAHVRWGFWKSSLMPDPDGILGEDSTTGGSMSGAKLSNVKELPAKKILVKYIRAAVKLNEEGKKIKRAPKATQSDVEVPPALSAALKKNAKARKTFEGMSPSHQREYSEWIADAKQESTREKRLATALEWLAEGKSRNWKYQ